MMIKVVKDIRNQVNQVLRIKDQHRRNITSWMHITPNMVKKHGGMIFHRGVVLVLVVVNKAI